MCWDFDLGEKNYIKMAVEETGRPILLQILVCCQIINIHRNSGPKLYEHYIRCLYRSLLLFCTFFWHFLAVTSDVLRNPRFCPISSVHKTLLSLPLAPTSWNLIGRSGLRYKSSQQTVSKDSKRCQRWEAGAKNTRNRPSESTECSPASATFWFQESPWSKQTWPHTTRPAPLSIKMPRREATRITINIQQENSRYKWLPVYAD
jgi:hypothetical protein